jgi:hypothetical protein
VRIFIVGLASKKLLVSVFLLFLAGMVFGVPKITVEPPQFTSSGYPAEVIDKINVEAVSIFREFEITLNKKLYFLPSNVHKPAGGFANASVFSSDGASQRGYEGYNAFSLTFGFMGALQLPQFTLLDDIKNAIINSGDNKMEPDFMEEIFNIPFGVDAQVFNAQLGINTSKFLLKGLYLGFKFGMFDTDWIKTLLLSDFSFRTMSVGINASYQLISQKRLFGSLFVWRGLNLGAGFTWQNTHLIFTPSLPIDDELKNVQISLPSIEGINLPREINFPLDDSFHLSFDTYTYIIPLGAMTSIRLLGFLNVALGAGVDIAFGVTNIDAHGSFDVRVNDIQGLEGLEMKTPPSVTFSLPGTSAPGIFNPKVMGAMGFNFGPIIIDIPFTYYFKDNGFCLGFTLGLSL